VLKHRILTALVLIPLVLWGILELPTGWFAGVFGLVVVLGAWEWARLIGWIHAGARGGYAAIVAVVMAAAATTVFESPSVLVGVFFVAVSFWLWATRAVLSYDGSPRGDKPVAVGDLVVGILVLVPAWLGIVYLHSRGPQFVLFMMVLVWTADTAAYFSGRKFGKNKLAPRVSPGKTLEGLYGAVVATGTVATGAALWLGLSAGIALAFVSLSMATVLISVVGDLFESMYKRQVGVKDSGTLLPGHGGVLDRIDSMTAAAPAFALGLLLLGELA